MGVQVENLEHNLVKLTVEIPLEDLEKGMNQVYLKNRSKITLPGFRKGKAPRMLIEKTYGKDVFFEDAINDLVPEAYEAACREAEEQEGIKFASYPEIDYVQTEFGKPVIFTATVAKRPEVKLGDYKGVEVEVPEIKVTEEEIEKELQNEAEKNATFNPVEDRPVADGDMITLDFLGKVDGEAFEGGQAEDYSLTIGSHSFIEGFEEQLIGMAAGETKDINVTFPEQYQAKELAGKPAVFTCTVKTIKAKEVPAIDDEFASEVSDFETLAEYKEEIRKKLTERRESDVKRTKEDQVLEKVTAAAKMDIPDQMVTSEARNAINDFAQRLQAQGLSFEQYLQYAGMNESQILDNQKEQSKKMIEQRLTLEAVAAAEGFEATMDDVDARIEEMAAAYQMDRDQFRGMIPEEQLDQIKADIVSKKALDFLAENAVEKIAAPAEKAEEA